MEPVRDFVVGNQLVMIGQNGLMGLGHLGSFSANGPREKKPERSFWNI